MAKLKTHVKGAKALRKLDESDICICCCECSCVVAKACLDYYMPFFLTVCTFKKGCAATVARKHRHSLPDTSLINAPLEMYFIASTCC